MNTVYAMLCDLKKLFFCFCANHSHHPHFGAKIVLDFAPANGANLQENQRRGFGCAF